MVFTEFKTTLDYLVGRLREDFPGDGVVLQLFGVGDMDENERKAVTDAFNDLGSTGEIFDVQCIAFN